MPTRKNPITDPDGSKAAAKAAQEIDKKARTRVKQRFEGESIGEKAKKAAEAAGTAFTQTANTVSSAAGTVASGAAKASEVVSNTAQALGALTGYKGYTGHIASGELTTTNDAYGGLTLPQVDFKSMVPTDLLNPEGLPECSEEQLTNGLSKYASAKRAMELYQAGFTYISEVGKAKLQMHKAQGSVVKAATEEVKVQQEIVNFDIANVGLEINKEKFNQSNEKLRQEQVKTLAAQNETAQLIEKTEALEGKRSAEIQRIRAQTSDIIQKYLKDSIQGAV